MLLPAYSLLPCMSRVLTMSQAIGRCMPCRNICVTCSSSLLPIVICVVSLNQHVSPQAACTLQVLPHLPGDRVHVHYQVKAVIQEEHAKVLHLEGTYTGERVVAHLKDGWCNTPVEPGHCVNLIAAKAMDSDGVLHAVCTFQEGTSSLEAAMFATSCNAAGFMTDDIFRVSYLCDIGTLRVLQHGFMMNMRAYKYRLASTYTPLGSWHQVMQLPQDLDQLLLYCKPTVQCCCPVLICKINKMKMTGHAGMVILHPDLLLSGTRVTGSFKCERQAVLEERFGGSSSDKAVEGTLLHELFQVGSSSFPPGCLL